MADHHPNEGPSTSNVSGETSDSSVQLNVKTLDSQIYSFLADKKMPVLAFKEKIASQVGVPVNQQRLIFRGRVLKDEHLLSEYQVENGHTLHLVVRQSAQTQPSSETSSGDARGNDASYGGLGNRPSQIPHSVLLGTFSVADQGDGMVPDLNRVIGSVLNSIGIGGLAGTAGMGSMPFPPMPNATSQTHQGNGTGGNVGGQNQAGNPAQAGNTFQSQPQVVQIPLATSVPIPSFHSPIPDSLNTISEFLSRMEQVLAQNGSQQGTTSTTSGVPPRVESPSNVQGLPALEALSTVLRQAERLLSGHAVASLSNLAGRLEGEGTSPDLSIRSQIQTETVQSGLAMQHLGALFLELGRTLLTFRMGQSPGESSIHSGPAVYISPSGPNTIMAQPFPLQTQSLFGGISGQSSAVPFAPVGVGNAPRHVNIHIHAGTTMASVLPTMGVRANSGEPGTAQGRVPGRSAAAAVPAQTRGIPVPDTAQPDRGDVAPDLGHMSSMVSSINSRLRDLMANFPGQPITVPGSEEPAAGTAIGGEQQPALATDRAVESSGPLPDLVSEGDTKKMQDENVQINKNEEKNDLNTSVKDVSSSSVGSSTTATSLKEEASENVPSASARHDPPEGAKAAPLGLGLGSLDRKKRVKQQKPSATTDGTQIAQQLLQTLSSRSSAPISASTDAPSGQTTIPVVGIREGVADHDSDVQVDAATAMSQALRSPGFDNLLAGVSEQTGFGSPDILRNMMQGLTQNPQIMNAVSQIAQQVDTQDIGDMFSGAGRGQGGGGFDLSRMVQQMMPVVSQVLGQGSAAPRAFPIPQPVPERITSREPSDQSVQMDLHAVAQRIEHGDAPEDIFRAMAENAARLSGNDGASAQDLSNSEDLVNEYLEVLRRDIRRRCEGDSD
ncbi:unnamed protein product [Linum trigynum]|uniref:Ubiquitin-like domain-containing protein n=1 Tax=Linum trigynum TaxID=586398 RepID=A0AAV2CFV6_9ROSI